MCLLQQDVKSTSMILLALSPVLLAQCNCAPRGHLGKSEGDFGCHNWEEREGMLRASSE